MTLEAIKKEIRLNIGSSSSRYREQLATQILADGIPLQELIDLLLEEHPVSTRFSWLLGDISTQSPDKSKEILQACFGILPQVRIKNFDRTLAKQAMICGPDLPENLEGEIVHKLFDWLIDPTTSVSTKNHCLFALENLCKKYPELKAELITCINDQKVLYSKDFQRRADKVLINLSGS
jgi:hypothetical protein